MIQDFIGNTALRPCSFLSKICEAEVWVKEEFHNPCMSAKDRPALYMVKDAIANHKIPAGGTFVEASSGNTGLSIAVLAKELGYKSKIFVSSSCSEEKRAALRANGADVVVCNNSNGPEDPESTQFGARAYAEQHENTYFTDQYFNPVNMLAHFETTGPEIWEQTEGKITHFIAGVGTGGTISGIGKFLKMKNKDIRIIGVEPTGSIFKYYIENHQLPPGKQKHEAIEGIGRTFLPGNFDTKSVDQVFQVNEADSRKAAQWYKKQTGTLTGFSTAAILAALKQFHSEMQLNTDSRIVTLFPDHGGRYISKLYDGIVS